MPSELVKLIFFTIACMVGRGLGLADFVACCVMQFRPIPFWHFCLLYDNCDVLSMCVYMNSQKNIAKPVLHYVYVHYMVVEYLQYCETFYVCL